MAKSLFPFSMATSLQNFHSKLLMFALLMLTSLHSTVAEVGVCFGQLGTNLPCPRSNSSIQAKQHHKNATLRPPPSYSQSSLRELMVGIPDSDLSPLAKCQSHADAWVHGNITSYPNVKFRHIVVGNEISPSGKHAPFVLPAMRNIYNAIRTAGLDCRITVSTSIKTDLLEKSSPPQDGEFTSDVTWYIKPIVEFLSDTNAPLGVNVYPYFAYMHDMKNINLSFALLQPDSGVVLGGVYYDNLFYAMVDAVYAAMEKILSPSSSLSSSLAARPVPPVSVTETGHSTKAPLEGLREGDGELSTVENARIYNNNLMRIVKKGTPERPGIPIETYIFAMFDEDGKPGPEYERHFGIFLPNGKPKYRLRFY